MGRFANLKSDSLWVRGEQQKVSEKNAGQPEVALSLGTLTPKNKVVPAC